MIVAAAIGAGQTADAFYVAYGIPNLLRVLFAEGALSAAFIPVFTREATQQGGEAAKRLSGALMVSLALILAAVTLLGVLAAPYIVRILVPGFTANPSKYALTVVLTRVMFPLLFFIGLAAVAAGILNTLGHFLAPAFTPVFFNLSVIACALFLAPRLETPVVGLAWGVVIGGAAQLIAQIKPLHARGQFPRLRWEPRHPGSRRIAQLMVPAVFGFSIAQIGTLVDRLLASFLPEGSISFLYYAYRLLLFPLGIFGTAMSIAVFPSLSAHAARNEQKDFLETMGEGLRLVLFVCVPSAVGLAVLAAPITQVLFERGAFTAHDTAMTARAAVAYAAGLVAYAGVKIVASAFYSLQDTRTPVKVAAFVLLANVVLNLILMVPLRHAGLALASALCAYLNVGLLLRFLRRRLGRLGGRAIARSFLRISPPTLAMTLAVYGAKWMMYAPAGPPLERALALGVCLLLGASVYLAAAKAMGCEELALLRESFRGRKLKGPPPADPGLS